MTATVRKTDEELTDKRICKIGGLMTDWGLTCAALCRPAGMPVSMGYEKRAAKRPLSTNTKTKLDLIDESKIFTNLRMPLQIYCKLFIFQRK